MGRLQAEYLRVREVVLEHLADVLRVREVERGVHLVQDVQRRGLEQQHGQHQRQRHQRALPARQLAQRLLPRVVEPHLHLRTPLLNTAQNHTTLRTISPGKIPQLYRKSMLIFSFNVFATLKLLVPRAMVVVYLQIHHFFCTHHIDTL